MRVAFDATSLTSPAGGVRRYARELFGALARHEAVEVIAVAPQAGAVLPPGVGVRRLPVAAPTNLGRAAISLPLALTMVDRDVFHAPAYTAPLWGAQPLVLTIHDAVYARRPEWYPGRIDPVRRWFYRASARRARRIITDSTFSRNEIVAAYGIRGERIDVVPLGVSAAFRADPGVRREPFVLHVGDIHPRRNLSMLLSVILDLRRSQPGHQDLRLVLVGTDRGSLAGLQAEAAAAGAPGALEHVTAATDEDLMRWYQRAAVLAYPSRYEGFGLPVAEAMACGTPVIAAQAASMPEVLDGAGILIAPDDARGWREALLTVLGDAAHAGEMTARGLARAGALTWERTAERTLEVYRRVSARET